MPGGRKSRGRKTSSDAASSGLERRQCATASDVAFGDVDRYPCETPSDAASSGLVIGGVQWTTLIDYPGRVAAALFTVGCNFRCPFCHNPGLVDPDRIPAGLDERALFERLRERIGFLDGVVLSGGEPTIQASLPAFVKDLRKLGFLVKLDTNGSRPDVLGRLLAAHAVDYIAMDIKAPLDRYGRLIGTAPDVAALEESIALIVREAADYEFRTTVAPTLDREDILRIADWLSGAKRYVLQTFRVPENGLLDSMWETRPALSKEELDGLWDAIRSRFSDGGVRG